VYMQVEVPYSSSVLVITSSGTFEGASTFW
jgi:hypothetical protein